MMISIGGRLEAMFGRVGHIWMRRVNLLMRFWNEA